MNEREDWLRAFHDARPGITARAFARGGSYARLAAQVAAQLAGPAPEGRVPEGRVLDVACGDGTLLGLLGPRAIGIDIALGELHRARGSETQPAPALALAPAPARARLLAQARAQELPFADASFDAATCHLAFMLFDDLEQVIAELARVLRPGAAFIALLGGGPTADGDDAFHAFAKLLSMTKAAGPIHNVTGFGDKRASTEAGWRELFRTWGSVPTFERWPLDLSGTFDEVWTFLSSSYQLRDDAARWIPERLRAQFPRDPVPCTVVTYCATVTR